MKDQGSSVLEIFTAYDGFGYVATAVGHETKSMRCAGPRAAAEQLAKKILGDGPIRVVTDGRYRFTATLNNSTQGK